MHRRSGVRDGAATEGGRVQARISPIGILDQRLQVQLCVSNPNERELAFSTFTG